MTADNYTTILLEDLRDQNKLILEIVISMQERMDTFATKDSVDALSARMDTMTHALTATNHDLQKTRKDLEKTNRDLENTNRQLNRHEVRMTKLETVVFRPGTA